jgi:hypothetical protein
MNININIIKKMFFIVFIIFMFTNTISAASINSVTWGWNGGYLGVEDYAVVTIDPDGAAWCNAQVNSVWPTPYQCGEHVCVDYTVQSSHTDRLMGEIPVVAECCDDQAMTLNCDDTSGTDNSSPGVDTGDPTNTSITISDSSGYTNDSAPDLTLYAEDAFSGMVSGGMRFSCDNSSWTDWTSYSTSHTIFNLTSGTYGCNSSDGTKKIHVQYRDSAYTPNISSAVSDSTYYDTTGPTGSISISKIYGEYTSDSTPTLTLSANDGSGSGVYTMQFSCNGSDYTAPVSYISSYDGFNIASGSYGCSSSDGSRTVYVRYIDNLGNIGSSSTDTVNYDSTAPSSGNISASAMYSSFTSDSTPTLTISASDPSGSGVKDMRFSCNNSNWSGYISYNTSYSNFNITTGAGCNTNQGNKVVYIKFRDYVNNETSGTINSNTIIYDSQGPIVTTAILDDFIYSGDFIRGTGNITTENIWDYWQTGIDSSDIDTSSCQFSINAGSSWSSTDMSWLGAPGGPPLQGKCKKTGLTIEDGVEYNFGMSVLDNVVNRGSWISAVTYTGDTQAPTTELSGCEDEVWYNEDKTITLNCDDNYGSGCKNMYYNINGNPFTQIGLSGWSFTFDEDYEGDNEVNYYSVDQLDNLESTSTSHCKMDYSNPITTGDTNKEADGNNGWYVSDVDFEITEDDNSISGVNFTEFCTDSNNSCTLDTNYTEAITLSSDGNHYVRFRSTDNASNVQDMQSSGLIKIDQTNPTTTGDVNSGTLGTNDWYISDVNFVLSPVDATSGIDYTYYCSDSENTCTPTTTYTGTLTLSTDGNHYIRYRSVDLAGNVQDIQSSGLIKIDQTNPITTGDTNKEADGESDWYITNLNYIITPEDEESGVYFTQYCVDSNNSCTPDTNYTSPIILSTQGYNYVRFRTIDNASNVQDTQSSGLIKLDKTEPLLKNWTTTSLSGEVSVVIDTLFDHGFNNNFIDNIVIFNIDNEDKISDLEFDDSNSNYLKMTFTENLDEGEYYIEVKIKDEAGHYMDTIHDYYLIVLDEPDIISPIVTVNGAENISQTLVDINFQSNETGTAEIFYGKTNSYGLTTIDSDVTADAINLITLGDLDCGTTYHYAVFAQDVSGNTTQTSDYNFTTLECTTYEYDFSYPNGRLFNNTTEYGWFSNTRFSYIPTWDINFSIAELLTSNAGPEDEQSSATDFEIIYIYNSQNGWITIDSNNFEIFNLYNAIESLNYIVFDLNVTGTAIRHG